MTSDFEDNTEAVIGCLLAMGMILIFLCGGCAIAIQIAILLRWV